MNIPKRFFIGLVLAVLAVCQLPTIGAAQTDLPTTPSVDPSAQTDFPTTPSVNPSAQTDLPTEPPEDPSAQTDLPTESDPSVRPDPTPVDTSTTASGGVFYSADERINAPVPPGEGWEFVQAQETQDGVTVSIVKCRRTAATEFFFLNARVYNVPSDVVQTAQELASTIYRNNHEHFFATVTYTSSSAVDHRGHAAWEVTFDATHAARGAVRKIERVIVLENLVFILSAEGEPSLFDQMAPAIQQWMDEVVFADLP
jgi:hypothetical protein